MKVGCTSSLSTLGKFGLPTNLSSVSIVDVTGSDLSRRVAHALMGRVKGIPSIRFVEARTPESSPRDGRIGEVVIFVEEFKDQGSGLYREREVDFQLTCGPNPAFGWTMPARYFPAWSAAWRVRSKLRVIGLPGQGDMGAAEAIADFVNVRKLFDSIEERGPDRTGEIVEAFSETLLPDSMEAPGLDEVAAAARILDPPLLQGRRIGRPGEAWWRVLEDDIFERLDETVTRLKDQGWRELEGGSDGADGETHHAILGRGTETVDLQFEEGRPGRYVQESWSQTVAPDGTRTPRVHHLKGQPIESALWIHYWNVSTDEELLAKKARLESTSPASAAAFISALPYATQWRLGASRDELPEAADLANSSPKDGADE